VQPGELLALLGPNGAGKTTTVRMLSAILKPSSGRAAINGMDVVKQPQEVRKSIGLLTEQPGLYERMTGLEYLIFYGRLYGMADAASELRARNLLARFAMPETGQRRLSEYSKGMRQKVGLIRAMLHDPSVLLLDEPTSAMDPHSAKLVRDAIAELRQDRRAILLCTHNLSEAERLADRIAIIRHGQILALDSPGGLKKQLLGHPLIELTVDRSLNGEVASLMDVVPVETIIGPVIRYRTQNPVTDNPMVVRHLTGLGVGVVSLTEVTQSLEDVYLRVVGSTPEGEA
jgi:ABC-2 type transport system ATP-binding protein